MSQLKDVILKQVHWYRRPDGMLEGIHINTGDIVPASTAPSFPEQKKYHYNEQIAHELCERLAQGGKLTRLAGTPPFPPMTVIRLWRIWNPDFDALLKQARTERAEWARDKIMDIVDLTIDKDEVAAMSLKSSLLMKLAQYDDKKTYGSSNVNIDQSTNVAQTFIIETGVRREGDPGFIKDVTAALVKEGEIADAKKTEARKEEAKGLLIKKPVANDAGGGQIIEEQK